LKSFRSSDRKGTAGIEFGSDWHSVIMANLANATDVVALCTKNSLNRPWILYEVGVAKGKLGTRAFGLALGVPPASLNTGPFAQFQNCGDDEDSLTKLVLQMIKKNPDASPREQAVRTHVAAFRKTIASLLANRPDSVEPGDPWEIIGRLVETNQLLGKKIDSLSDVVATFVQQLRPLIGVHAETHRTRTPQKKKQYGAR